MLAGQRLFSSAKKDNDKSRERKSSMRRLASLGSLTSLMTFKSKSSPGNKHDAPEPSEQGSTHSLFDVHQRFEAMLDPERVSLHALPVITTAERTIRDRDVRTTQRLPRPRTLSSLPVAVDRTFHDFTPPASLPHVDSRLYEGTFPTVRRKPLGSRIPSLSDRASSSRYTTLSRSDTEPVLRQSYSQPPISIPIPRNLASKENKPFVIDQRTLKNENHRSSGSSITAPPRRPLWQQAVQGTRSFSRAVQKGSVKSPSSQHTPQPQQGTIAPKVARQFSTGASRSSLVVHTSVKPQHGHPLPIQDTYDEIELVSDDAPLSYWCGRFASLDDHARNVKLENTTTKQTDMAHQEETRQRTLLIMQRLYRCCQTEHARFSLQRFHAHANTMRARSCMGSEVDYTPTVMWREVTGAPPDEWTNVEQIGSPVSGWDTASASRRSSHTVSGHRLSTLLDRLAIRSRKAA